MDAKVTVTMTPKELDLVRSALRTGIAEAKRLSSTFVGKERAQHKEIEAQFRLLLEKLS